MKWKESNPMNKIGIIDFKKNLKGNKLTNYGPINPPELPL